MTCTVTVTVNGRIKLASISAKPLGVIIHVTLALNTDCLSVSVSLCLSVPLFLYHESPVAQANSSSVKISIVSLPKLFAVVNVIICGQLVTILFARHGRIHYRETRRTKQNRLTFPLQVSHTTNVSANMIFVQFSSSCCSFCAYIHAC